MSLEPTESQRPTPTAFCGRPGWPLLNQLSPGDDVVACYLILQVRRLQTKQNEPYLRLLLGDRSGSVEAVIWDDVDRFAAFCVPSAVVGIRGQYSTYQDRPQLRINTIEAVDAAPPDLELLIPASERDPDLMERELEAHIASIRDRNLRSVVRRCVGKDSDSGRKFRRHAAATRNHHAYLYGLLEHTLSVASLCERLAEHYRELGCAIDRDMLIAGALLHDVGKTIELDPPPTPTYTTQGKLIGHIVLGMQLVATEGAAVPEFPQERLTLLLHLIASHQGKPEWDSPRVPQTIEAILLHYADDLDSKMNSALSALTEVDSGAWSGYDRSLGRSMYHPPRPPGSGPGNDADMANSVMDLFGED